MNILIVFPDFNPTHGGVPRVTHIITKELILRGHKVFYLSQNPNIQHNNTIVPVIYIDLSQKLDDNICYYQNILSVNNIDIIINQLPLHKENDFFLKYTLSQVKTISVFHSKPFGILKLLQNIISTTNSISKCIMTVLYYIKTALHIYLRFIRIIRLSDKLCLLSEYFKTNLLSVNPFLPADKIISIGNPIEIQESINEVPRKKQILFVGRLSDPCKNLLGAIQIWEKFVKTHPDWSFRVLGEDSGIDEIKKYIDDRAIPNVKFMGHVTDVVSNYSTASFILVTSYFEGWPMVICEAMLCGCIPCAYSTYETIFELISDGESGIICKPFDSNAMVDRLNDVLLKSEIMGNMSQNAMTSIKKYSAKVITLQWEELFEKLKKS